MLIPIDPSIEGGLTTPGRTALAILVFAVVMWVTEAVSYLVSAIMNVGQIALVSVFTILIHLGFASATSLASALIPIFIALAPPLPGAANGGLGFVIIQQFLISFGFLLPVSAPQNMLAYGTGAFTAKQFLRTGIPLTIVGYLLVLLFSATYWKWLGLV